MDTIDDVDELMAQEKRRKPSIVATRNRSIKSYSQKNLISVLDTSTVDAIGCGNSIFYDDLSFGIDGKLVDDNATSKGKESSRINIMDKMSSRNCGQQMFSNEFENINNSINLENNINLEHKNKSLYENNLKDVMYDSFDSENIKKRF